MDSYDVIISPYALAQLDSYISYVRYTLLNPIAAERIWRDALETRQQLSNVAGSLKLCDDPDLHRLGYHAIDFTKHKYVMLYRIEARTAYVDAVYHQMQDYEHTFSTLLTSE